MMRNILLTILIMWSLGIASCKKSSSDGTDNNPAEGFSYKSLSASDSLMKVNEIADITASATGTGLTYEWKATYGTFIGSGSHVQWTVCHADNFTITCTVKDNQGHSDAKSLVIRVQN